MILTWGQTILPKIFIGIVSTANPPKISKIYTNFTGLKFNFFTNALYKLNYQNLNHFDVFSTYKAPEKAILKSIKTLTVLLLMVTVSSDEARRNWSTLMFSDFYLIYIHFCLSLLCSSLPASTFLWEKKPPCCFTPNETGSTRCWFITILPCPRRRASSIHFVFLSLGCHVCAHVLVHEIVEQNMHDRWKIHFSSFSFPRCSRLGPTSPFVLHL